MELDYPKLYMVQAFLHRSIIERNEAETLWIQIKEHHGISDSSQTLDWIVAKINGEIINNNFQLIESKCNVSGERFIVFKSLSNRFPSASKYSASEISMFKTLLENISTQETLTFPLSQPFGFKYRHALDKLIRDHYIVIDREDAIQIGVRSIVQYESILDKSPVIQTLKKCMICNVIVYYGEKCNECNNPVHFKCSRDYYKNNVKCVSCKKLWKAAD